MKLSYRKLLFVVLAITIAASCTKRYAEVAPKERAIEALNNRDYDKAITLLTSLLVDKPNDGELSVLLASAYGGQVGINVVDAFGAFKPLLYDQYKAKKSSKLVDEEPPSTETTEKNQKLERSIARFIEMLADGIAVYFFMPYADARVRPKLVTALLLLEDIPKEDASYDRVRALQVLLNLAQFLNYLRDAFPGLKVDSPSELKFSNLICSLEPSGLVENLQVALEYLKAGSTSWKDLTRLRDLKYNSRIDLLVERSSELGAFLKSKEASSLVADVVTGKLRKSFCD